MQSYGTIKPPDSLKDPDKFGSSGTRKNLDMRAQESVKRVNESHDIRKSITTGDTFAPQFHKELNREVKKMNFAHAGEARSDSNLHSDTTMPGDTEVSGMSKGSPTWTPSADEHISKQIKAESYDIGKVKKVVEMTS